MKLCTVEGCTNKHRAKRLCNKHYRQLRRTGQILNHTHKDPNEIVEYDDYAEIILYDKDNKEIARTLIDLDDIEKCKQYKWYLHGEYACNSKTKTMLHRFLLDVPEDMIIDHINRDKLDNRKENLRVCTYKDNNRNMSRRKNVQSVNRGVYKSSKNGWVARIKVNEKDIYLGTYNSLQDAIAARQQAEIDYFGDFAPHLNDKE